MSPHIPALPVYHYQFEFAVAGPVRLPRYPGSAWRGAFGHALKRTVCIVRDTACADCMLQSSCAYSYIFETPPPANAGKMRKYTASPHPFVLRFPQQNAEEAGKYRLELIVIGQGQKFFPYIVHALQKAGQDGIGSGRQPFILENIRQRLNNDTMATVYQAGQLTLPGADSLAEPPPMPDRIELVLHTPLRIKQNGRNLTPQSFNFGAFFGNLLRRISMLTYFHGETPLETDFAELTRQARQIQFSDKQLQWFDWKRYSSRQDAEMNMGGVVGTLSLAMPGLEPFWPYLWLGQWIHAGKGTSMGLGYYSIETASLPSDDNRMK
ncbi:CRISPR system precrRNA processing endoribonuclease RAMP protein Cas6 [Methylomarinum vadi]|uniref:CRISPR system precrRNA processing endoribonuclease RAMP protein Cas6 n=1 Tax=Methylomarinum vadi TaxID=438855 RepID=UPI0004DF0C2B|nr:CRISPR system precrRNA processing endoribonuclease RAMP protein Cas6 [Methylomarinum vadi]